MALELLKTIGVLAVVLGLILGLAYLARRLGAGGMRGGHRSEGWRLLGVKSLGPKRHVYVLEVGKRILLIGATDRMIATLGEIDDEEDRQLLLNALSGSRRLSGSFQDVLRRAES